VSQPRDPEAPASVPVPGSALVPAPAAALVPEPTSAPVRHVRPMNGPATDAARSVVPLSEEILQAIGCTTVFEPGWETDAYEGVAGLCRPFQRDLYGCASDCWWPAQVPDELSNYGGWSDQCGNAEKDWANVTFIE
jgi:hypothetical protein